MESDFWDWKTGDVAAVVTAVAAVAIAGVSFFGSPAFTLYMKCGRTWPTGKSVNSIRWNRRTSSRCTDGLLDGLIRFDLTIWPRWGTYRIGDYRSLHRWSVTVNDSESIEKSTGIGINRKDSHFIIDVPRPAEYFSKFRGPANVALNLQVPFPSHDDRIIDVQTQDFPVWKDPSILI